MDFLYFHFYFLYLFSSGPLLPLYAKLTQVRILFYLKTMINIECFTSSKKSTCVSATLDKKLSALVVEKALKVFASFMAVKYAIYF